MDARLRDVNTPIDGVMTDVLGPPPVLMGCSNGECQFQVFAGCNCPSVALKGMYEIRKGDALPRTPLQKRHRNITCLVLQGSLEEGWAAIPDTAYA